MIKDIINRYHAFYLAIIVFFTDRFVKIVLSQDLLYNENLKIWNGILSFTKTYNTGAAFGMLKDNAILLAVFSIIVIISISVYLIKCYKSINEINSIAWGLILGGTLGNVFDRLIHGYVIDFIKLEFINFPIFNIADLCINIGSIILVAHLLFFPGKKQQGKCINSELTQ